MDPYQPPVPAPGNNYDFILNPGQPTKKPLGGKLAQNSFFMKIAFIVGGSVVLMIVLALAVNLFLGSKTNVDDFVSIAQTEQEIVRLSAESDDDATDQAVKNASVNTELSLQSHQQAWLALLGKNGRAITTPELALKKNATTDKKLADAKLNNTFDSTYATVMREQLGAYSALLKSSYARATSKTTRELLQAHYNETQLLLKQWPK